MKTIETTVFEFGELSDSAKETAREWYRDGALDYDWWDSTYEDAANIGLKLTGFELDRNRHAEGYRTFRIAADVAQAVIENHGKHCETYKTAKSYLKDLAALEKEIAAVDGDDETNVDWETWQDKRLSLDDDFENSLIEDYSILLQHEYDYQLSNEAVDEMIVANGYTFTETGRRYG